MFTGFVCENCKKEKSVRELVRHYPPWDRDRDWDYKVLCMACSVNESRREKENEGKKEKK